MEEYLIIRSFIGSDFTNEIVVATAPYLELAQRIRDNECQKFYNNYDGTGGVEEIKNEIAPDGKSYVLLAMGEEFEFFLRCTKRFSSYSEYTEYNEIRK